MGRPNVFLFVPNLIGYVRILLLGCSLYSMSTNYKLAILFYVSSYMMDAVDGLAARLLNQSSVFGALLDMLTDRISTMCLLVTLGNLYVNYLFVFQLLLIIDIVSHWMHFFSSTLEGKTSHKKFDGRSNFLMKIYYENKLVLTSVCAMEQIFYCSLLIYYHESGNHELSQYLFGMIITGLPAITFKNYINLLQIYSASKVIGSIDSRNHGQ